MSQPTYQGSTAADLIAFAKENGVELPEGTSKNDAWKAVKEILADLGEKVSEDNEHDNQPEAPAATTTASVTQSAKAKSKDPTHYTISISKPTDVKQPDLVICANGTNYQIHFGKQVKVPAVVVNILKDAVERKPAHRDMETNEWVEESFEPRYSFAIHQEHFQ